MPAAHEEQVKADEQGQQRGHGSRQCGQGQGHGGQGDGGSGRGAAAGFMPWQRHIFQVEPESHCQESDVHGLSGDGGRLNDQAGMKSEQGSHSQSHPLIASDEQGQARRQIHRDHGRQALQDAHYLHGGMHIGELLHEAREENIQRRRRDALEVERLVLDPAMRLAAEEAIAIDQVPGGIATPRAVEAFIAGLGGGVNQAQQQTRQQDEAERSRQAKLAGRHGPLLS